MMKNYLQPSLYVRMCFFFDQIELVNLIWSVREIIFKKFYLLIFILTLTGELFVIKWIGYKGEIKQLNNKLIISLELKIESIPDDVIYFLLLCFFLCRNTKKLSTKHKWNFKKIFHKLWLMFVNLCLITLLFVLYYNLKILQRKIMKTALNNGDARYFFYYFIAFYNNRNTSHSTTF